MNPTIPRRPGALVLLGALVSALAACSSTPPMPPAALAVGAAAAHAVPAAAPRDGVGAAPASSITTVTLPAYLDPGSALGTERSIFFGFDDFTIDAADGSVIARHGKFLAANPAVAIRVEGNADERGGTEYNLALGQKRAEAVLQALRIYGVRTSQMEAVSWGEGKPRAAGEDESAWAQNRRADLRYPDR